ncbi:hypothetical protein [Planococcus lenghuensis]|uniref:Uncharacterized protein n=1 Tax=Planococcus lenghuensis TaxID=2213202 RepID=A0A1Q2L2T4_9BACL|nr:hypothetical protein [Planococcus lenghuensis]AQQ54674.1 hypothetical protein B0X71_17245 [Planococcus lenghuensis]
MTEKNENKSGAEAEQANRALNGEFYEGSGGTEERQADTSNETSQANADLNDEFYSGGQSDDSIPPLYVNNNTPAIDVTKKKDRK